MWKLQFDHTVEAWNYFQACVVRTGMNLSEGFASLAEVTLPHFLAGGSLVWNYASEAWDTLTEDLYLGALSGMAFVHDATDLISADLETVLSLVMPGTIEAIYLPLEETELPSVYSGEKEAAVDDGNGFAWTVPTSSSSWERRWFVAARSIYRNSGFFRPEFAFVWSGSTLGENHIVTRCMSTGPFQVCDGYYGHIDASALWYDDFNDIWHPRETWYDVPGPTYPLGYWGCQRDPYSQFQEFYLTEWQEGIDLDHHQSGSMWSMNVLIPALLKPFFAYPVPIEDSKPRKGRRFRQKLPGLDKNYGLLDFDDRTFAGRGLLTGNDFKHLTIGEELVTL